MRVLLAPFFEENQYLSMLSEHLEKHGIDVERSTTARPLSFPLLDLLRSDADVFHLHWTHPYFLFGSYERFYRIPFVKYACWTFALIFLAQLHLVTHLCDRVVWTVHNKCNHERRYETMDRWVSQRVFRIADVVQVWDESTKRELSKYLGVDRKKMIAVPHGNYLPLYPPEKTPSKFEARRELGMPRDDRIFLYFGMIRPYKQVPRLLDIWNEVDPENAHLMIAGNPKYDDLAEAIKTRASRRDDVTADLRYIPENEVPTYFAACDVAVFPYKDIFSSGSVVLAMSMGRAFVAPATGAIPSLDPGRNIVYDSLYTGIKASLNIGTAELNRAGRINIQIARSNLAWESICTSFASLYCCSPKSESVDGSSCKRQS